MLIAMTPTRFQSIWEPLERRPRRLLRTVIAAALAASTALASGPATAPARQPKPQQPAASRPAPAHPGQPKGPTSRPASQPTKARPASQPAKPPDRKLKLQDDGTLDGVELLNLEVPAVVTAAGRREQKISQLPYAVSVITKEDIRQAGARNVTDALRLAPGVDVAELSYGQAAVGLRGFQGFVNRTCLILVDGRQIYDPLFGGSPWGSWPFMLEDIERIEVLRGPAGVTWGANAVNGVINIVTKDPIDQKGFTSVSTAGSRGVAKEYDGYGFQIDKLRVRASGEYERTDGFRSGGSPLMSMSDNYKAARGSVYAVYDATPNDSFTITGGSGIAADSYTTPPGGLFETGAHDGSDASFLMGQWRHRVADDNHVDATVYANDFWSCNGVKPIDYRYQQLAFQIGQTFSPAQDHTLTWGFDSRWDMNDLTNADPNLCTRNYISSGTVGLYAQDEWRFAPEWALTLGGRIDYEFYGGFQPQRPHLPVARAHGRLDGLCGGIPRLPNAARGHALHEHAHARRPDVHDRRQGHEGHDAGGV